MSVIPRELLKDRAYRQLMDLIQTGVITPESAVSERQLVARLGMSKTPIRAALENLETQGMVTVSPQRGILIKELTAREIRELFDVRNAIEPFIVSRLASRGLLHKQLEAFRKNLSQQKSAAMKEDPRAATRLDIEFHRMLGRFLDNQEMNAWLEKCFDKLQRSVLRINSLVPGRLHKSTDDHVEIFEAIQAGESDKSAKSMLSHLRYGERFLLGSHDDETSRP